MLWYATSCPAPPVAEMIVSVRSLHVCVPHECTSIRKRATFIDPHVIPQARILSAQHLILLTNRSKMTYHLTPVQAPPCCEYLALRPRHSLLHPLSASIGYATFYHNHITSCGTKHSFTGKAYCNLTRFKREYKSVLVNQLVLSWSPSLLHAYTISLCKQSNMVSAQTAGLHPSSHAYQTCKQIGIILAVCSSYSEFVHDAGDYGTNHTPFFCLALRHLLCLDFAITSMFSIVDPWMLHRYMSFEKSMWLIKNGLYACLRLRGSVSTQTIGAISNFISNAPQFSCLLFNLACIFRLHLSAATYLPSHCSASVQAPSSSLLPQCKSGIATNIADHAYQMLPPTFHPNTLILVYCLVQLMWSPAVLLSLELVRLHCHLEFVTSPPSLSCLYALCPCLALSIILRTTHTFKAIAHISFGFRRVILQLLNNHIP
jgi:hypothetical protein